MQGRWLWAKTGPDTAESVVCYGSNYLGFDHFDRVFSPFSVPSEDVVGACWRMKRTPTPPGTHKALQRVVALKTGHKEHWRNGVQLWSFAVAASAQERRRRRAF